MTEEKMLVPMDMFLQSGIHIGAKFKTKFMEEYIYKIRPDGLSVLNISKINERLKLAGQMLSKYGPEKVIAVCRRENGFKALKAFSKATGIRVITGRYYPGTLTNPSFDNFFEPELVLVSDPWLDRQIVKDAKDTGVPIIALCDTNNTTNNVDLIIPCNNKGNKALSLAFFVLAREYLRNRGIIQNTADPEVPFEEF